MHASHKHSIAGHKTDEMTDLGRSRSNISRGSRPARPQLGKSRPSSPHLHRFFSAQHLDDQSVYHAEHDIQSEDESSSTGDLSEQVTEKDDEEAREHGQDEVGEERMGVPNTRDLEAGRPPLEKRPTSRSVKDPNLVSRYHTWDHAHTRHD